MSKTVYCVDCDRIVNEFVATSKGRLPFCDSFMCRGAIVDVYVEEEVNDLVSNDPEAKSEPSNPQSGEMNRR